MQNEERSKLEERIIAYFDGSLDGEGSRSLLREIAETPEKRSLFKAHETLSRLIAAAREPMEAPLEVKRSIAEKIPGMLAFLPSLFGAAETAPVLTESSNPFIAFFARMSLSTAVAIGGAVAVVVTSGILIKNNIDQNAVNSASPKTAVLQNAATTNSLPANLGTNNSERTNSTTGASSAHNIASTNVIAGSRGIANSNPVNNLRVADNSPVSAIVPQDEAESANSDDNTPVIAGATAPLPSSTIAPVSAKSILNGNSLTLSSLPIIASEGVAIRMYASEGDRFLYLNGINKSGTIKGVRSELLGMEFDLGDRYIFRVQAGQSRFAAIENNSVGMIGSQKEIQSSVVDSQQIWTTVGMSYSFTHFKIAPIIVSGDVGAVWFKSPAMIVRAGVATEIPLFGNLALRPSLTYDWVSTSLPPQGDGIYKYPINQTSMWSSALGFNLGFVFQY